MRMNHRLLWLAVAGALGTPLSPALSEDRTPDQILEEIDRLGEPRSIRMDRPLEEIAEFRAETNEMYLRRSSLILEFYRLQPDHDRIPELMTQRWNILSRDAKNAASLPVEINEVLFGTKDQSFRIRGLTAKARVMMLDPAQRAEALQVINLVIRLEGAGGKLGPGLLSSLARRLDRGSPMRDRVEDRLLHEYPETAQARLIAGARRRVAAMGQPFDLTFRDAISGATISTRDLRGKVVVIDFWATWCPPCIEQLPRMKAIYQQYHEKGVEFIGVSLDRPVADGGLEKLRAFVAANGIPWPQYHQAGDGRPGSTPEWSTAWGVDGIPTVFVLDADGRLVSDGSDKPLEQLIPELLERAARQLGTSDPAGRTGKKAPPSRRKKRMPRVKGR